MRNNENENKKARKAKKNIKTISKKINSETTIPILEPSKVVDFHEFKENPIKKDLEWEKRKKELLFEQEMRLQKIEEAKRKAEEEKKNELKKESSRPFFMILIIIVIMVSITGIMNMYRNELLRQKKEQELFNDLENGLDDSKNNSEKETTSTLTCTSPDTPIENYIQSITTITQFENNKFYSYESIFTKKFADIESYNASKVAHQNVTDVIFDNNQFMIKTYFGNGHIARTNEETNYIGHTLNEIKSLEEAKGFICNKK